MSADRDLAEAIYREITSEEALDVALEGWRDLTCNGSERNRLGFVLAGIAAISIDTVLARRQREAARTGPWEGGHHCQEEDGYPGSLAARCHTVVLDEGEVEPKRGTP
jgi:hypothetical protein